MLRDGWSWTGCLVECELAESVLWKATPLFMLSEEEFSPTHRPYFDYGSLPLSNQRMIA
jgi:hypothetical protein